MIIEENISFEFQAKVLSIHEHIGIDMTRSDILYAGLKLLV